MILVQCTIGSRTAVGQRRVGDTGDSIPALSSLFTTPNSNPILTVLGLIRLTIRPHHNHDSSTDNSSFPPLRPFVHAAT